MNALLTEMSTEEKVAELAKQVTRLDGEIRSMRSLLARQGLVSGSSARIDSIPPEEQLRALLHAADLLSDDRKEWTQQRAREWDDMSAAEKEAFILEFQSLDLSPALSDIIIQNRR